MPSTGDPFRFRGLAGGVPAVVWLLTGAFSALLLLHTALTPLYRAPDEARHVDQVLHLRDGDGYPPPGKEVMTQQVLGSYVPSGYAAPSPKSPIGERRKLPLSRQDAPDLSGAPAFRDVPPPTPPQAQLNQMTQHPPLYYAVGAAALWLLPYDGHLPFPWVVGLLRLYSVLCLAPLPLLAFAVARRLSLPGPVAVAAAAVPFAVPQLAHIGSAVSNDSLLIGTMSLLTVQLTFVATGDLTKRTAVLTGLTAAAALFTKAFALAAVPWLVVAYAIALHRTRSRLAVGGLIVAGATSALGGWWYLVNLLRYGKLQSEETQVAFPDPAPGFAPSHSAYFKEFGRQVSQKFWGSFGYYDIPLPRWFTTSATLVLLGLLVVGAVAVKPRLPGLQLLLPLLGIAAIMVVGTYGLYADYGFFPGLQGRYLFPALAAVSVLAAAGLGVLARRWAAPVAIGLAAAAQLYGTHAELDGFWGGSLRTVAAWSWYPGLLVYLVALALVGLVAAAAVVSVKEVAA